MAARQFYYAEVTADSNTNLLTYQDKVTLTFTPDASSDYFLIGSALITNENTASSRRVFSRLTNTTSGTVFNEFKPKTDAASEYCSVGFLGKDTFGVGPPAQTYKIQYEGEGSSLSVAHIKEARIIAIKKDAADQYVESLTRVTTTTTASYVDAATLTFTPATQGDYIILAVCQQDYSSTISDGFVALNVDGTLVGETQRNGHSGTSANLWFWGTVTRRNLTAASHTIKIQHKSGTSGNTSGLTNQRIIAIRADTLPANYYTDSQTRVTTTSATYQSPLTLTQTVNAVNHLMMGVGLHDNSTTGAVIGQSQFLDEASVAIGQQMHSSNNASEHWPLFVIYERSLTAGSKTWKLQYESDGTNTTGFDEMALSVLQLDASSTQYTSSQTAALSFVGAQLKLTNYPLTAALSFVGAIARLTSYLLSASLSFTTAIVKAISHLLIAASASFTGAFSSLHQHFSTLTGALSFTGSHAKQAGKSLSASSSFTSTMVRVIAHTLSSTLSFTTTSIIAGIYVIMSAAVGFSGNINRSVLRALTGATLSFTGLINKTNNYLLTATQSFSGKTNALTSRALSASQGFSGNVAKAASRPLSASVSFAASIVRQASHILSGAVSFATAQSRAITHSLTSSLSFSTTTIVANIYAIFTASVGFSGGIAKRALKPFSALLSLTANFTPGTMITALLSSVVSFSGNLNGLTSRALSATFSFGGTLSRTASKGLAATVSFAGNITRAFTRGLSSALSFVGAQSKSTFYNLTGSLSFSTTAIIANIYAIFTSAVGFGGNLNRAISRSLSSNLNFTGALGRLYEVILAAALSLSGSMNRLTSKALTATVGFIGLINRLVSRSLSATLSLTGLFGRIFKQLLSASLSFGGTLVSSAVQTATNLLRMVMGLGR